VVLPFTLVKKDVVRPSSKKDASGESGADDVVPTRPATESTAAPTRWIYRRVSGAAIIDSRRSMQRSSASRRAVVVDSPARLSSVDPPSQLSVFRLEQYPVGHELTNNFEVTALTLLSRSRMAEAAIAESARYSR
jgi:hypothetical protein